LRPIAFQCFKLARDLVEKPPTLSRITRKARKQHLHWVCADGVDVPQPAAVVAIIVLACGKCGHGVPETEEAGSQIRVLASRNRRTAVTNIEPVLPVAPALGIS